MSDTPQNDAESSPAPPALSYGRLSGMSLRVFVLALVFDVGIALVTTYNDEKLGNTLLAGNHFPLAPTFILVLLALFVNLALAKLWRSARFTGRELLTLWLLMVVPSGIASSGLCRFLWPVIMYPPYFASEENGWANWWTHHLRQWLVPDNHQAITDFWQGVKGGRHLSWTELVTEKIPWSYWWRPLLAWTVLILGLYLVMAAVVAILRRQWVNRENLSFPLLQVPLEICADPEGGRTWNRFLRSRVMWLGAAIPLFFHGLNGLHQHFPEIPEVPLVLKLGELFTEGDWRVIRDQMNGTIWFSFVGISFLLSKDISLSFWFFYVFAQVFTVYAKKWAFERPYQPHLRRRPETSWPMGAMVAYGLFILWIARRHLWDVLRKAVLGQRSQVDDHAELFSYRTAVLLLLFGFAVTVAWCYVFGMSLVFAVLLWVLFLLMCVVGTRLVCQAGIMFVQFPWVPVAFIVTFTGSAWMSTAGIVIALMLQRIFMYDMREFIMPNLLHAAKGAPPEQPARNRFVLASVALLILTLAAAYLGMLATTYKFGGLELGGYTYRCGVNPCDEIQGLLKAPFSPLSAKNWQEFHSHAIYWTLAGAAFMLVLLACYRRFTWWPIHPIGMVMVFFYAIRTIWFSFLLGWIFKVLVLRYGGSENYDKFRNFFLGLVLGDVLVGGIWGVVNMFSGERYYILPP